MGLPEPMWIGEVHMIRGSGQDIERALDIGGQDKEVQVLRVANDARIFRHRERPSHQKGKSGIDECLKGAAIGFDGLWVEQFRIRRFLLSKHTASELPGRLDQGAKSVPAAARILRYS